MRAGSDADDRPRRSTSGRRRSDSRFSPCHMSCIPRLPGGTRSDRRFQWQFIALRRSQKESARPWRQPVPSRRRCWFALPCTPPCICLNLGSMHTHPVITPVMLCSRFCERGFGRPARPGRFLGDCNHGTTKRALSCPGSQEGGLFVGIPQTARAVVEVPVPQWLSSLPRNRFISDFASKGLWI
jgi:hypothetical protein